MRAESEFALEKVDHESDDDNNFLDGFRNRFCVMFIADSTSQRRIFMKVVSIFAAFFFCLLTSVEARGIRIAAPIAPGPSQPPLGATGVSISPEFDWSNAYGVMYHYQIATDSLFSRITVDDSVNWLGVGRGIVGPLSYNTKYYWRVNCHNTGTGPWSAIWYFTTVKSTAINPVKVSLQRLSLQNGDVLKFSLPQTFPVRIRIYDSKGVVVKTLVNETRAKGSYTIPLPKEFLDGFYLLDFTAGEFHKVMPIQGK
jgi:hypothetical protein